MPTAIELHFPDGKTERDRWKPLGLVFPQDEYGTIIGFEGGHVITYVIRCKKNDSTGVINKLTPYTITTGPISHHALYETGTVEELAILRRGWEHREFIRFEPQGRRKLVRFIHL